MSNPHPAGVARSLRLGLAGQITCNGFQVIDPTPGRPSGAAALIKTLKKPQTDTPNKHSSNNKLQIERGTRPEILIETQRRRF